MIVGKTERKIFQDPGFLELVKIKKKFENTAKEVLSVFVKVVRLAVYSFLIDVVLFARHQS